MRTKVYSLCISLLFFSYNLGLELATTGGSSSNSAEKVYYRAFVNLYGGDFKDEDGKQVKGTLDVYDYTRFSTNSGDTTLKTLKYYSLSEIFHRIAKEIPLGTSEENNPIVPYASPVSLPECLNQITASQVALFLDALYQEGVALPFLVNLKTTLNLNLCLHSHTNINIYNQRARTILEASNFSCDNLKITLTNCFLLAYNSHPSGNAYKVYFKSGTNN